MVIIMNKLNITPKYAHEFNEKCARVNAHGFLRYVSQPNEFNISLLDLVSIVDKTISYKPFKHESNFEINENIISKYIIDFFSRYLPLKVNEVTQILQKTHSYFIDENNVSHVNFIKTKNGDSRSSSVGHCGRQSFLNFNVFIHNSIDDLRTTAHEITHALSGHHQQLIKLIRSNAPQSVIDNYTKNKLERDGIGEIESHIVEGLFNRYLVKIGLFTQADLNNYEQQQMSSLLSETNLIREESDILKHLSCPVTFESLNCLVKNLQLNNNKRLLYRVVKMHDDSKSSMNMFRYFVGRIVANQWLKRFDGSSPQSKQQMLNEFQDYLNQTHNLTLDSACNILLNNDFSAIVEDYVLDKVNERKFGK